MYKSSDEEGVLKLQEILHIELMGALKSYEFIFNYGKLEMKTLGGKEMITGFCCTNIFSKQAKELVEFYTKTLEIPLIRTDDDESNGVYLGFIENAPTICIWDCTRFDATPTGYQSFVFQSDDLDSTIEYLKKKGVSMGEPVRYDWGTYEVRLNDIDGNEVVICELWQ